jgi:hypothetical protein
MVFQLLVMMAVVQVPCAPMPKPSTTPTLTVEVVDEAWLPLPGMTVIVRAKDGTRNSWQEHTNEAGTADFWIPKTQQYDIEAFAEGFKKARRKGVLIGGGTGPIGARFSFDWSSRVRDLQSISLALSKVRRGLTAAAADERRRLV